MQSLAELGKSQGQDLGKFWGRGNPGSRIWANFGVKEILWAGNFRFPEMNRFRACFCSLGAGFSTFVAYLCPLGTEFCTFWADFGLFGAGFGLLWGQEFREMGFSERVSGLERHRLLS